MTDYQRIEKAIQYIRSHFKSQPGLDEIAGQVSLSPFHFQRLFTEWAGISPKKFVQFLSVEYAKELLHNNRTLSDVSFDTGLSGTGRLHDLFIGMEGMTPGEYKNGGETLTIQYRFAETPFGEVIIASTGKGICYLAFVQLPEEGLEQLREQFPNARLIPKTDMLQEAALRVFNADRNSPEAVKLHLKGTPFQVKVWKSLLQIPFGGVSTYGGIATAINQPAASRAVGSAVGSNPVAFLIPCHRVIQSTGLFGQYHWGEARKAAMLGWEAARSQQTETISKNRVD